MVFLNSVGFTVAIFFSPAIPFDGFSCDFVFASLAVTGNVVVSVSHVKFYR